MTIDWINIQSYEIHEDTIYNMMVKYGSRYFVSDANRRLYEDTAPRSRAQFIESLLLLRRLPRRILFRATRQNTYEVLTSVREWLHIEAFIKDEFSLGYGFLVAPESTWGGKINNRSGLFFSQLWGNDQQALYHKTKIETVILRSAMSDEEVEYIKKFWSM